MTWVNRMKITVIGFPVLWIASLSCAVVMATSAFGQETSYESSPEFKAPTWLTDAVASGPSHNVRSPVGMEGLHYSFDLWSRFGWFHPESMDMLKIRLAEIQALDALAQMQQDPLFLQGLNDRMVGQADAAVAGAGGKRSFRSSENIPLGLSDYDKLMDAVSSEFPMFSKEQFADLHDEAVRNLAASFGVGPYTDNVPLRTALNDVAANNNREAIRSRVEFRVIPGVGSALEAAHFSKNLQDMLLSHTEANLEKETRKDLNNLGVPKTEIDEFMTNPGFPLSWRAAITESLLELSGVDGIQDYIPAIQDAPRSEVALFYLRRIQLAEKYHRSIRPLSKMVMVGATPLFVDQNGVMAATAPVDHAYWNEDLANRIAAVRKNLNQTNLEIYIPGTASDLARKRLTEQGLTLHEKWGVD